MAWGIPEQLDFTPKHILRHNGGYVVVGVDGDFVGMYSANLTGGVKVNYPWPLHNGPELGFDLSA